MGFDIAALCTKEQSEEGSWMDILDMDYVTPIGAQILVLGPDSAAVVKFSDDESRKAIKAMAEIQMRKKTPTLDEEPPSDSTAIRKAAALTKGWRNLDVGGKEFKYSPENAVWLYTNSPHIRDQVLRFYQDRANFTKTGSKSLSKRSGESSGSTTPEAKKE